LQEIKAIYELKLSFKDWWFFDTNCLSELIKQHLNGNQDNVENLIRDKFLLISSSNLLEISKRPDLANNLFEVVECSNVYVIPNTTIYWQIEISSFLKKANMSNILRSADHRFNNREVPILYKLESGFSEALLNDNRFLEIVRDSDNVRLQWQKGVRGDIGQAITNSFFNEIILWSHISRKMNEYSREWFKATVPVDECTLNNFPSFFTYWYTYYYRYMKNHVTPEKNDFEDIQSANLLPYCTKYFGERKFTNIFKSIKNMEPPSIYKIHKEMKNSGVKTRKAFKNIKSEKVKRQYKQRYKLFPNTEVFNFRELVEILKGDKEI
jgi:hypothetical protein